MRTIYEERQFLRQILPGKLEIARKAIQICQAEAWAMGGHPRLGAESPARILPRELIEPI